MSKNTIKNLGTIDMSSIEITGSQIEVFIYLDDISTELDAVIERCISSYKEDYPEVEDISFCVKLVFSMGYANPEFELHIEIFESETMKHCEEYDSFFIGDIELSEDQKKQIKKVMWDKLGETLLNL